MSAKSVTGQHFYEIYGPEQVHCSQGSEFYGLETSVDPDTTLWQIAPPGSANVIYSDNYTLHVEFSAPGTYEIYATSYADSNVVLMDTLIVIVTGLTQTPGIIGCFEYDSIADCYQVCAFSKITLFNIDGSISNYSVSGALEYSMPNIGVIEIIWGAGGSGIVTLLGGNCATRMCFEILPLPKADFQTQFGRADTITVCKGQEVSFENLSTNGLFYQWDFGDGGQSDEFDAVHAFDKEGSFTVTLTAGSICDCSDIKQIVIQVEPEPAPALDCINSVCPETRQRYTAATDGCTQFSWSVSANGTIVNGGEPSDDFIEVIWHVGPDGFIELSVSGCNTAYCASTAIFRVPVISPDGPVKGDASVCSGEIATYTAPYFPGTTYQWQVSPAGTILGDRNTNAVTIRWNEVNAPTSAIVEVQYENCFLECGGSAQLPVTITPEIRITGDLQVCQDDNADVSAEAGFSVFNPVPVSWHLENSAGVIVYQHAGTVAALNHNFNYPPGAYYWVATESSGNYCNDSLRLRVEVTRTPDTPVSIKGETEICPGLAYGYTIESAGNYTTLWTVTDGTDTHLYQGQSIQHAFGPSPPYLVEAAHAHIQYQQCTSPSVMLVVNAVTDLSIEGPDEVCYNGIDNFSAKYVNGVEYLWEVIPADHGEIRKSNLNTVEVFWTQSGPATLRLNACGVIVDKVIEVRSLPVFQVTGPMAACAGETVSISTDQPAFGHIWKDEQGNFISTDDTVRLLPGSYVVSLTNPFGCIGEKTFRITSYPSPVVHLSTPFANVYCSTIPNGVTITANTDGPDDMYTWYHNDIELGVGSSVFPVTSFGSYHVAVTNQYGCTAISEKITFLDCCPVSSCTLVGGGGFPGGCTYLPADLMIQRNRPSCEQHVFIPTHPDIIPGETQWVILSLSKGIVTLSNADVLDYTYTSPGYYFIDVVTRLSGVAYSGSLCGSHHLLRDTVRAVSDFKYEGICAGSPVEFEDLTTFLPGEMISSWAWDFGDPSSGAANVSVLQDPSHTFATAGIYEVTLTATLVSGCSTTRRYQVQISDGPILAPQYETVFCENEALAFYLPGDVFDIAWDFGDPSGGLQNTAQSDSAFHTYDLPGMYTVHVEASDVYGCRSQADLSVDIRNNTLSGTIDVVPGGPLCYGDTATLTAPTGGTIWSWSNGDNTESITVDESDQYSVLIRDGFHCTYTPPPVFIEIDGIPELLIQAREIYGTNTYGPWQSSLELCYGTEFEIQVFSETGVTFQWQHGPAWHLLQFTDEGGTLPLPGIHTFDVVGINPATGCTSDTASISIEIFPLPTIPVITLSSGSGCSFDVNVLIVTNPEAGITYVWSDGQEGASIIAEKSGAYFVTAMNPEGCSSDSEIITIKPSASVDQLPGGCFIACDPLQVCLPPVPQLTSYTIYQNGSIYESGTSWPDEYIVTQDGSYTIEVVTANGCVAISDPLDVVLYTGTGTITVITYEDTDGDGMIGPGDAILSGIDVQVLSDDGMHVGKTLTGVDGSFDFTDYPATDYTAFIDRTLLSPQWRVLIDSARTQITTCGDSVVVSLLLAQNCTVAGPDAYFDLCPGDVVEIGDTTLADTGTYVMHMMSASGCDSVFNVVITTPDSLDMTGFVWVDVDHDGAISPLDTLAPGIPVDIFNNSTGGTTQVITGPGGTVGGTFMQGGFDIRLDTSALSANYIPIIYEVSLADTVCGSVEFHFLIVSQCPSVFLIMTETLCPGDSVEVLGEWISEEGVHAFTLSDPVTLCDTILDVYVDFYEEITLVGDASWNCIAFGQISVSSTGDGPLDYIWSPDVTGDTLITNLDPGSYMITVTDAHGCAKQDTFTIEASEPLDFFVPETYAFSPGDSIHIPIGGDIHVPGVSFVWNVPGILSCPACPSTWVFPTQDTTILIEVTGPDSCTYLLETRLIQTIDDAIYIPNVFSPNNDGINDFWRIVSKLENTYAHELKIFDRWGELVFIKEEFLLQSFEGWDGMFRGKPFNPGVFVYVADISLGDGRRVKVSGDVTLVR